MRAAVQPGRTRVLWVETPTNPLLGISDIAALAEIAHEHGATLVVDNTFATPYLQQPIGLGPTSSCTRRPSTSAGTATSSGSARRGRRRPAPGRPRLARGHARAGRRGRVPPELLGAIAGPFDAWLTLRGLKTLAVRMDRHSANAAAVAEFLEKHPQSPR
ncbi:PLP-dependent transferase [Oerskovia sp. M15]